MIKKYRVDIAIIVPKEDELRALEWAFDTKFKRSDGTLSGGKYFYEMKQRLEVEHIVPSEISIAIVFMNDQGNSVASGVTQQVLSELDPAVIFLVGTAAGRKGKIKIGSVVASQLVVDAQEWRLDKDTNPRIRQYEPPEGIRSDVSRFIGKSLSLVEWRNRLVEMPTELYRGADPANELWQESPDAHVGYVASSNYLHLNPKFLRRLWDNHDRIYCIDMESGGFGGVCKTATQKQWLVVRGISDYGTHQSKKEAYRIAAAASAALFLRMFIERGLVECHPYGLRVPESNKSELSLDTFYTQFDVISIAKEVIKNELDIDLIGFDLGSSLSLADLESICEAHGADRDKAHRVLSKIREDYFTNKYIDYTYQNDLRGLVPNWANEINNILANFSVDLKSSTVVDVGIGNGLEVPYLFTDVSKLMGVDISEDMLKKAVKSFPSLKTVQNSAEDMHDVRTGSVDLYISLRTYQSSLFDIPSALREAQRVLKSKGIIVVSIANGFVVLEDGEKKVLRGLLVPGSRQIVDKSTPRKFAEQVVEKLTALGFESVGYLSAKTDIYIWGQKP